MSSAVAAIVFYIFFKTVSTLDKHNNFSIYSMWFFVQKRHIMTSWSIRTHQFLKKKCYQRNDYNVKYKSHVGVPVLGWRCLLLLVIWSGCCCTLIEPLKSPQSQAPLVSADLSHVAFPHCPEAQSCGSLSTKDQENKKQQWICIHTKNPQAIP